jgi:hypothetical protein
MDEQSRSNQDPDIPDSWVPPEDGYPADFKPVVVRHPSLKDAAPDVWLIFAERFEAGFYEFRRRLGYQADLSKAKQELRAKLFDPHSAELILPEEIMDCFFSDEDDKRAQAVDQAVQNFRNQLVLRFNICPASKGRKLRGDDRDNQIYDLRKQDKPYPEIAKAFLLFHEPRNAPNRQLVRMAYQREAERRRALDEWYVEYKPVFFKYGIIFVEEAS